MYFLILTLIFINTCFICFYIKNFKDFDLLFIFLFQKYYYKLYFNLIILYISFVFFSFLDFNFIFTSLNQFYIDINISNTAYCLGYDESSFNKDQHKMYSEQINSLNIMSNDMHKIIVNNISNKPAQDIILTKMYKPSFFGQFNNQEIFDVNTIKDIDHRMCSFSVDIPLHERKYLTMDMTLYEKYHLLMHNSYLSIIEYDVIKGINLYKHLLDIGMFLTDSTAVTNNAVVDQFTLTPYKAFYFENRHYAAAAEMPITLLERIEATNGVIACQEATNIHLLDMKNNLPRNSIYFIKNLNKLIDINQKSLQDLDILIKGLKVIKKYNFENNNTSMEITPNNSLVYHTNNYINNYNPDIYGDDMDKDLFYACCLAFDDEK